MRRRDWTTWFCVAAAAIVLVAASAAPILAGGQPKAGGLHPGPQGGGGQAWGGHAYAAAAPKGNGGNHGPAGGKGNGNWGKDWGPKGDGSKGHWGKDGGHGKWGFVPVPVPVPVGSGGAILVAGDGEPAVSVSYYGPATDAPASAADYVIPANPAPGGPAPASRHIAVVNPATTGVTLQFVVDGEVKALPAATRLELAASQPRTVEFDRGGSFGQARYTLSDGLYTFTETDHGWELYQTAYATPGTNK